MRVTHFPDFLPDETVFSVAARYLDRMQFPSNSVANKQLFGGRDRGLVTDLPSSLDHFVQSLPYGHKYTVNTIIDQHTLYPFYSPFLSSERMLTLKQQMKEDNYFTIHSLAGARSGNIPRLQRLRYCPTCINDDRLRYGECYWHRIHQAPGVLVCPIHERMLEDSNVNLLRKNNTIKFCSAESTVPNFTVQRIIAPHLRPALVTLARNVKWLLENWVPAEQWSLRQSYIYHLTIRGFSTAAGLTQSVKLKAAISDYYPADLLETLGCTTLQSKGIWFSSWTQMHHPLHHLLLIQFLCETTQKFFTESQALPTPFGDGPWPCLNQLCSHYKERVIETYAIKQGDHQPVGTFACPYCEFVYTRTGPDKDESDIFRGRASQYGAMWDQHLTKYWLDQNIPTGQIARLMHTYQDCVRRQAARLNLPFAPDIPCRGKRPTIAQDYINEKRFEYRTLWEDALKSIPCGNLNDIITIAHKAYKWLKRHDSKWLKEHYPVLASRSNNAHLLQKLTQLQRENYMQTDIRLAGIVRKTAKEICARPDFPVQVSRRVLVAQIGNAALTKRSDIAYDRFPLTFQALKEVTEDDTEFLWRKLRWAVQSFLTEGECPAYFIFLRRTHISKLAVHHPIYKKLIHFAYEILRMGSSLTEHIPETLGDVEPQIIMPNDNHGIETTVSGSLASVCISMIHDLQRPLKREKEKKYRLLSLLLLIVAAVVSSAETYGTIALWGYRNEKLLLMFGFPQGQFPCPATLKRLPENLCVDKFDKILGIWLRDNFPEIKIDETTVDTESVPIPGMRLLRAYRHIASAIIAKLC